MEEEVGATAKNLRRRSLRSNRRLQQQQQQFNRSIKTWEKRQGVQNPSNSLRSNSNSSSSNSIKGARKRSPKGPPRPTSNSSSSSSSSCLIKGGRLPSKWLLRRSSNGAMLPPDNNLINRPRCRRSNLRRRSNGAKLLPNNLINRPRCRRKNNCSLSSRPSSNSSFNRYSSSNSSFNRQSSSNSSGARRLPRISRSSGGREATLRRRHSSSNSSGAKGLRRLRRTCLRRSLTNTPAEYEYEEVRDVRERNIL